MSTHSQRVRLAPDVVLQVVEGEALLLKLQEEEVFSLNETGARIAQLIGSATSVTAIVDALSLEYGHSREEVARDVVTLVDVLLARGLAVPDDAGTE